MLPRLAEFDLRWLAGKPMPTTTSCGDLLCGPIINVRDGTVELDHKPGLGAA